jgi:hypothetical protein
MSTNQPLQQVIAKPLTTNNTTFLIEKTAASVPLTQFIRELTQNAIEAKATKILWTRDLKWEAENVGSGPKLCVVDNGSGMSARTLEEHMSRFASSGKTQGVGANYGVGAKLAAAAHSPHGVVFKTWEKDNSVGSTCVLVVNPAAGLVGLLTLGNDSCVAPVPLAEAPDLIRKHGSGTVVTLLGNSLSDDTTAYPTANPTGQGGGSWVGRQLAMRYFDVREGVQLSAQEFSKNAKAAARAVETQQSHLDRRSENKHKGVVKVLDANYAVRWWLLDERDKDGARGQINPSGAQHGVLYEGELYSVKTGPNATRVLQKFGILAGAPRVAIYVEPLPLSAANTNLERTRVELPRSVELPIEEIADDFVANMPGVLRAYVEEQTRDATLDTEKIADRLLDLLKKMDVGHYRRSDTGTTFIDPDDEDAVGGASGTASTTSEGSAKGGTSGLPGSGRGAAVAEQTQGDRAKALNIRLPKVLICSDENKTKGTVPLSDAGPRIQDRAAVYIGGATPTLYVNIDFRAYDKLEKAVAKEVLNETQATNSALVRKRLVPIYVEGLLEAVLAGMSLSQQWDAEDKNTLLTPEALTLAALQRGYALHVAKSRMRK